MLKEACQATGRASFLLLILDPLVHFGSEMTVAELFRCHGSNCDIYMEKKPGFL